MAFDTTEIARRVRWLRWRDHITQIELARKAGVTAAVINLLENEKSTPTLETIDAIAQAMGVTPGWLLGEGDLGDVAD